MVLFAFHAYWKRDWLAAVLDSELQISLIIKLYLFLAAIGFLVCVCEGTHALLWWLPANWGSPDQDGEFVSTRIYLSWASGLFVGCPLIELMAAGVTKTARANRLATSLHTAETSAEKLFYELEAHKQLVVLLTQQVKSLQGKSDR
jgi:hypothetical protein